MSAQARRFSRQEVWHRQVPLDDIALMQNVWSVMKDGVVYKTPGSGMREARSRRIVPGARAVQGRELVRQQGKDPAAWLARRVFFQLPREDSNL
jgi:hypothetical protein